MKNGFSAFGLIVIIALALIVGGGWYLKGKNQTVEAPAGNPELSNQDSQTIEEPITEPVSDESVENHEVPTPAPAASSNQPKSPAPAPIAPVESVVPAPADDATVFNLDARNYAYSRGEIRVKRGEKVRVILNVTEGFHDWVVDEFNAKTEKVGKGQTTMVEFTPDKSGVFEFYCSVGEHRRLGMVGNLVVI